MMTHTEVGTNFPAVATFYKLEYQDRAGMTTAYFDFHQLMEQRDNPNVPVRVMEDGKYYVGGIGPT